MGSVSVTAVLLSVLLLAACATERLAPAAPQGVNLTGEWNLNPNLSDDPSKLGGGDSDKTPPQRTPGGRRGRSGGHGGGGGGMPPVGGPGGGYNYLPVALTGQDSAPPPAGQPPAVPPASTRGPGAAGRYPRASAHLSITQQDNNLVIRSSATDGTDSVEEYKAGTSGTIPFGPDKTAQRSVGWLGPVFVITTDVKHGGWREDQLALDDEGHLIMTTQTKGGHQGNIEIKRVYDRARGAAS